MTNTIKHSPAPWTYGYNPYTVQTGDADANELPAFEIFDAEQTKIFDTNEDLPAEIQEANACLATAAPELLEALEAVLLLDLESIDAVNGKAARQKAMAVITQIREA